MPGAKGHPLTTIKCRGEEEAVVNVDGDGDDEEENDYGGDARDNESMEEASTADATRMRSAAKRAKGYCSGEERVCWSAVRSDNDNGDPNEEGDQEGDDDSDDMKGWGWDVSQRHALVDI